MIMRIMILKCPREFDCLYHSVLKWIVYSNRAIIQSATQNSKLCISPQRTDATAATETTATTAATETTTTMKRGVFFYIKKIIPASNENIDVLSHGSQ